MSIYIDNYKSRKELTRQLVQWCRSLCNAKKGIEKELKEVGSELWKARKSLNAYNEYVKNSDYFWNCSISMGRRWGIDTETNSIKRLDKYRYAMNIWILKKSWVYEKAFKNRCGEMAIRMSK